MLNYNYLYALNAWLLLNPTWLCFDWSMGCVPVITTYTDARLTVVILFWFALMMLLWHTAMCSGTLEQRYFTCNFVVIFKVRIQHCVSSLLLVICVTCYHILCLASSLAEHLHRDMYSVHQKNSPPPHALKLL